MRHFIAVVRFKSGLFFGADENYPKIVASFLGLGLGSIAGSMIITLT